MESSTNNNNIINYSNYISKNNYDEEYMNQMYNDKSDNNNNNNNNNNNPNDDDIDEINSLDGDMSPIVDYNDYNDDDNNNYTNDDTINDTFTVQHDFDYNSNSSIFNGITTTTTTLLREEPNTISNNSIDTNNNKSKKVFMSFSSILYSSSYLYMYGRYCYYCCVQNNDDDDNDDDDNNKNNDSKSQQQQIIIIKPKLSKFYCVFLSDDDIDTDNEELLLMNHLLANPDILQQSYLQILQEQEYQQQYQYQYKPQYQQFRQKIDDINQEEVVTGEKGGNPIEYDNDDENDQSDNHDDDYYYNDPYHDNELSNNDNNNIPKNDDSTNNRLKLLYDTSKRRSSIVTTATTATSATTNSSNNTSSYQHVQTLVQSFQSTILHPYSNTFNLDTTNDDNNENHNNQNHNRHKQQTQSQSKRIGIGHTERILGCDFSYCGQYLATASQDSTIRIWDVSNNIDLSLLLSTLSFNKEHEILRVTWASPYWLLSSTSTTPPKVAKQQQNQSLNNQNQHTDIDKVRQQYPYIIALGSANGIVYVYGTVCCKLSTISKWVCLSIIDHSTFLFRTNSTEDIPQIYSLQFVDQFFIPNNSNNSSCSNNNNTNSVLITSSDDYIHVWEFSTTTTTTILHNDNYEKCDNNNDNLPLRKKLKLNNDNDNENNDTNIDVDNNSTYPLHVQEVYSIQFLTISEEIQNLLYNNYNCHQYMTIRKVSMNNDNDITTNTPTDTNTTTDTTKIFGGHRNPNNMNYVFDTSYCTSNNILGVALSDGTVRLIHTSAIVVVVSTQSTTPISVTSSFSLSSLTSSIISFNRIQESASHITSLGWNTNGTQLVTCLGNGQLVTWSILVSFTTSNNNTYRNAVNESLSANEMYSNCYIIHSLKALYEGGHTRNIPIYGSKFICMYSSNNNDSQHNLIEKGSNSNSTTTSVVEEEYLLSWSADGSVCLWDCCGLVLNLNQQQQQQQYQQYQGYSTPISVLLNQSDDYPIYSVAIGIHNGSYGTKTNGIDNKSNDNNDNTSNSFTNINSVNEDSIVETNFTNSKTQQQQQQQQPVVPTKSSYTIAIVGGSSTPGFIGIPIYLYDVNSN